MPLKSKVEQYISLNDKIPCTTPNVTDFRRIWRKPFLRGGRYWVRYKKAIYPITDFNIVDEQLNIINFIVDF